MAVIVQYIVERRGKSVMTFTSKKEADAYDKMLDIGDELYSLIENSGLEIDDKKKEELSIFLAKNKDTLGKVLKGQKIENIEEEPKVPKAEKTKTK